VQRVGGFERKYGRWWPEVLDELHVSFTYISSSSHSIAYICRVLESFRVVQEAQVVCGKGRYRDGFAVVPNIVRSDTAAESKQLTYVRGQC
jgi:hypothetical protein